MEGGFVFAFCELTIERGGMREMGECERKKGEREFFKKERERERVFKKESERARERVQTRKKKLSQPKTLPLSLDDGSAVVA